MNRSSNRLINEKSPYLLQHAHNPVDWFPWGQEAFTKAKTENKPIFLSIGYSSCHWCHVMEKESFEDAEVAEILNEHFVSIKVDREERPDVDQVYMGFCQAMTGSGGWPMTIFMTEDKKPFHAGTYFPKESRYRMPGFKDILLYITEKWSSDKAAIVNSCEKLFKDIERHVFSKQSGEVTEKILHKTFNAFESAYDPDFGGFGSSPKFPSPHNLIFLMKYYKVYGKEKALEIASETLIHMYEGGIFDHIGFGFSRYSTDTKWLVPHFEKMLYDNALLASAYTEAFQITGNDFFKSLADKIFQYVLRDMCDEEGGFYSSEDADSEGEEGKFYLWTPKEIIDVLGEEKGRLFCSLYDIIVKGNFEAENIPNLIKTNIQELEKDRELKVETEDNIKKLFSYRESRIHPFKDRKILTSWNGLMTAALSIAGRVLGSDSYTKAAEKNMDFLLKNMVDGSGRLMARYFEGHVAHKAYIEDYAFVIWSLIELYETTFKPQYLTKSIELTEQMIELFYDVEHGGFFTYGKDSEELILRPKEIYDGAIPSGNSMAAVVLLRLYSLTFREEFKEYALKTISCFGAELAVSPSAHSIAVTAVMNLYTPTREIIICGNREDDDTKQILQMINKYYYPFTSVIINDETEEIYSINPNLKNYKKKNHMTTVYICKDNSCSAPANDLGEIEKLLQ